MTTSNPVRVLLIPTDGPVTLGELVPDSLLRCYRQAVGGYVQIIYPAISWHIYVDDRGSQERPPLPENRLATALVRSAAPTFSQAVVYGAAVAVGTGPGGRDVDIPMEVMRRAEEMR